MSNIACIIPARMGSSRLPGKPLLPLNGLPMIIHILERCTQFEKFSRVAVATCDQEIFDAVADHGGEAIMTSERHERCTDRVEEAVDLLGDDITDSDFVVMVQGDEISVTPEMLSMIVEDYEKSGAPAINLVSRLYDPADYDSPDTVKVVASVDGRALYLSRSPIPSPARGTDAPVYQQTGIIGFTKKFLHMFSSLHPTPLEIAESVDMLRVVEHGLELRCVFTETETLGVDTAADADRAAKMLAEDPLTKKYYDEA